MIIIDIPEDGGLSHYEVLGINKKSLEALEVPAITKKIRDAARSARKAHQAKANKGDTEAEAQLQLINSAESTLKEVEARTEYDKSLKDGVGIVSDVIKIQPILPPFFRDRVARFRVIERLMREAGLSQHIPLDGKHRL